MMGAAAQPGKVVLVGAGPGDPGLITLKGVERLREADVVLYDYLVNSALLEHAPGAELVCLGHHQAGRLMSQDEINARMVAEARRGKNVVRLKSGDPCVFGHSAEEIEALVAAGIPWEIVPGITAALAVAACTGIAITHGDRSSAVALVTGQERCRKLGPPLEYAALADFPGTLVFYMGVTSAGQWSQLLRAGGKPPGTPAAIVRRCSWPDQSIVYCTLGDLSEVIQRQRIRPPAVILIGEVAVPPAP